MAAPAALSYIHQDSSQCIQSELDLFLVPPTSTQIEKSACIGYQPVSSLSDSNVVEYFVSSSGDEYLDLSKTKLHIKAKIKKADGGDLSEEESKNVAPVNNWLHSLFSQLDIFLNDRLVSTSNNVTMGKNFFPKISFCKIFSWNFNRKFELLFAVICTLDHLFS